jgi:hypothetical protein
MKDKFNRLKHKKETATTYSRFDEVGMFEDAKGVVSNDDGSINEYKVAAAFMVGFFGLLFVLFSLIVVVRFAFSIPL